MLNNIIQALQAGTVRPPEDKPAASEGADGEVRGKTALLLVMTALLKFVQLHT